MRDKVFGIFLPELLDTNTIFALKDLENRSSPEEALRISLALSDLIRTAFNDGMFFHLEEEQL